MRNFLKGIGSIFNLMPAPRKHKPSSTKLMTPEEIHRESWKMVGDSFRSATASIDQALPSTKKYRRK